MAYATSEQIILQHPGATVYIDSVGVHFESEETNGFRFSGPMVGFINDLRCSLFDLEMQEDELQRKD